MTTDCIQLDIHYHVPMSHTLWVDVMTCIYYMTGSTNTLNALMEILLTVIANSLNITVPYKVVEICIAITCHTIFSLK